MNQGNNQDFSKLINCLREDNVEQFKAIITRKPMVLYYEDSKGLDIYQIACLYDKIDFVKIIEDKSKEFRKTVDREVPFNYFFLF